MANMLMIHHAATRGNERRDMRRSKSPDMRGDYDRRSEYDRPGMTYSEPGMRHPNQYTRGDYEGDMESRYRGRDGRWKAGRRRSEYDGGMNGEGEPGPESRRMGEPYSPPDSRDYDRRRAGGDDDEDEEEKQYKVRIAPSGNVIEWPYGNPEMPERHERSSRQIGFGAMNNMEHGMERENGHHMGRSDSHMEPMEFTRETAERWVRSMKNEDKAHPVGGKWSADMIRPLAQKYGFPTDGKKFWELYAMTNAMYSDYGEVARKFGITSPEFYVCLAKAWIEDKDAKKDKTALYYEYIVEKDDMGAAA